MKIRTIYRLWTALVLAGTMTFSAMAQNETTYHLKLVYETQPVGPDETFYVRLVLEEHSIDVGSYQLLIGYDSSRGSLEALHDNLGQAGDNAGAILKLLAEYDYSGVVSYADKARQIQLETVFGVAAPADPGEDFNLGRLEFKTSETYSSAQGQFGIYLTGDGNNLGFYDGMISPIPMEYISLEPSSGVADWTIY